MFEKRIRKNWNFLFWNRVRTLTYNLLRSVNDLALFIPRAANLGSGAKATSRILRTLVELTINPKPCSQSKYCRLPKMPELFVNGSSNSTPMKISGRMYFSSIGPTYRQVPIKFGLKIDRSGIGWNLNGPGRKMVGIYRKFWLYSCSFFFPTHYATTHYDKKSARLPRDDGREFCL